MALNVIELFGGIGAFTQAVKSLDLPINIVDYVEINPYSVKAYNAINGTDFPPQDITQFHAIGDKYSNIDVIMHGSPCFTADALVLTKDGYKKIIDVKVGDYVLTHENTYEKVVNCFDNGEKEVMRLKLASADLIKLTPNHRCYVRTKTADGYTNPLWKEAENLTADDYIGYAIHKDAFNRDRVWNLITRNGAYNPTTFADERIKTHLLNDAVKSWDAPEYTDALEIGHAIAYLLNKPFKLTKMYIGWSVAVAENCNDCFYMSDMCWFRVLSLTALENVEHVYDIEVENAHSFTVSGNIFHNCQDFSIAGKQKGGTEGSGTRSSLLYETIRIVTECKPKVVIWENVPNLVSSKFQHVFMDYVRKMIALGYRSYYKVLNAKDYGIPQNRERVFTVSILGEHKPYVFPEKEPLHLRLIDLLEKNVDESYYLSDKMIEKFTWTKNGYNNAVASQLNVAKQRNNANAVVDDEQRKPSIRRIGDLNKGGQKGEVLDANGICSALTSTDYKQPKQIVEPVAEIKQVGQLYGTETEPNPQAGRVYDAEGLAPTMDTCSGGNRMPKIVEPVADCQQVGNVFENDGKEHQSTAVYNVDGVAPTVCALANKGVIKVAEPAGIDSEDAVGCAIRNREDGEQLEFRKDNLVSALHGNIMKSMVATPEQSVTKRRVRRIGISAENKSDTAYPKQNKRRGRVQKGMSHTLVTSGNGQAVVVPAENVDPFIVASRGRNPDNPSDRTVGAPTTQHLEANSQGLCNTLTTVQKDNYVCEPNTNRKNIPSISFRIRKLTPMECFRLMGFSDECYHKVEEVVSKSRQYEMAGNSIVTNCLQRMLIQLLKSVEFEGLKNNEQKSEPSQS